IVVITVVLAVVFDRRVQIQAHVANGALDGRGRTFQPLLQYSVRNRMPRRGQFFMQGVNAVEPRHAASVAQSPRGADERRLADDNKDADTEPRTHSYPAQPGAATADARRSDHGRPRGGDGRRVPVAPRPHAGMAEERNESRSRRRRSRGAGARSPGRSRLHAVPAYDRARGWQTSG